MPSLLRMPTRACPAWSGLFLSISGSPVPQAEVEQRAFNLTTYVKLCSNERGPGYLLGVVIAPSDADRTRAAYLAKTPVLYRGAGGFHSAMRRANLGVGNFQFQFADFSVDGDFVAFVDGGDWTAQRRFWSHMADHQASGRSAEASVGEQGYAFAQALAYDRGGYAQHFAHAGSALGTFVANHYHVSGFDLLAGHGLHGGFFGIKDSCGAGCASRVRGLSSLKPHPRS